MRRVLLIGAALLFAAAAPLAAQGSDSLMTRLERAISLFESGKRAEANRAFQEFIDVYNGRGGTLSTSDLLAVAIAVTYLAIAIRIRFRSLC